MSTKNIKTYRINITVDEDLYYILTLMKRAYPALKEADLIKMATSGYFSIKKKDFEFVEFLDQKNSDSLMQAKSEANDLSIPTFNSGDSLINYLKNAK